MVSQAVMTAQVAAESAAPSMSDSVSTVFEIATKALELITGNPILLVFFVAPIVGIGIGVVRKLKR